MADEFDAIIDAKTTEIEQLKVDLGPICAAWLDAAALWIQAIWRGRVEQIIKSQGDVTEGLSDADLANAKREVEEFIGAARGYLEGHVVNDNTEVWPHLSSETEWWKVSNNSRSSFHVFIKGEPMYDFHIEPIHAPLLDAVSAVDRILKPYGFKPAQVTGNRELVPAFNDEAFAEINRYANVVDAAAGIAREITNARNEQKSKNSVDRWDSV